MQRASAKNGSATGVAVSRLSFGSKRSGGGTPLIVTWSS
jgi:hypothetical protein